MMVNFFTEFSVQKIGLLWRLPKKKLQLHYVSLEFSEKS